MKKLDKNLENEKEKKNAEMAKIEGQISGSQDQGEELLKRIQKELRAAEKLKEAKLEQIN